MILWGLLAILFGSYALLTLLARVLGLVGLGAGRRGRISLALLLIVTGAGHFLKTEEMVQMLPAWFPWRLATVYLTGILEWAAAVGLLLSRWYRTAGWCLITFLILVFPANVFAAWNHVPMGGHEAGPAYLLIRGPFQLLLIGWVYWFVLRHQNGFLLEHSLTEEARPVAASGSNREKRF